MDTSKCSTHCHRPTIWEKIQKPPGMPWGTVLWHWLYHTSGNQPNTGDSSTHRAPQRTWSTATRPGKRLHFAIENGYRNWNSWWFTHQTWWFSIVFWDCLPGRVLFNGPPNLKPSIQTLDAGENTHGGGVDNSIPNRDVLLERKPWLFNQPLVVCCQWKIQFK